MRQTFLLILIICSCSCGQIDKNKFSHIITKTSFDTSGLFTENSVLIKNIDTINVYEIFRKVEPILNVKNNLKDTIIFNHWGEKFYKYSSLDLAYFLTKRKKINNILPVIVRVAFPMEQQIFLITLNENYEIIDKYMISQYECGSGEGEFCFYKYAIFKNREFNCYEFFDADSLGHRDTIVRKGEIFDDGKIKIYAP